MAAKSLNNASTMKLGLMFMVCIAILAPSRTMADTTAVAAAPGPSSDSSFMDCAPFILEGTMCVVDVIKLPVSPHPSCCKAIAKLHDCSPEIYQRIPAGDLDIIKKICAL